MSISLNSDITQVVNRMNASNAKASKADDLQRKLSGNLSDATDEELMDVCKSFESYLLEQVVKKVKDAVAPEDDKKNNDYLAMFGDQLYTKYAEQLTDSGSIGLAQHLFEAMKRDYGGNSNT